MAVASRAKVTLVKYSASVQASDVLDTVEHRLLVSALQLDEILNLATGAVTPTDADERIAKIQRDRTVMRPVPMADNAA